MRRLKSLLASMLLMVLAAPVTQSQPLFADGFDRDSNFTFSSFSTSVAYDSAAFPELAEFDPTHDFVFLKLYLRGEASPTGVELVFFLGRVKSLETLRVVVTAPLGVSRLDYDAYGLTASYSGSVAMVGG